MSDPLHAAARTLSLLVVVVAGLALHGALASAPLVLLGRECPHAVEVAGLLRCDAAAPTALTDVCPGAPVILPLRSGDALRPHLLCGQPAPTRGGVGWRRMDPEDLKALALPVQINEADPIELASLPGVGPVLAGRIIADRPFAAVDELDRVKGIGPHKLVALRERARVRW